MKSTSSHTPSAAEPAKSHAPVRDSQHSSTPGACWSQLALRSAEGPAGAPGSLAQKLVAGASEDPGAPLPADARAELEEHLGADLSAVRLHTAPTSAAAAAELNAGAYTIGRDVHFGAGRFDPAGERGRQLLAHEVAHTVDAPTAPAGPLSVSEPSDPAETRARDSADAFIKGHPTTHDNNTTTSSATIYRALSDIDKQTWDSAKGDAHVEALRAAVGEWQTFRADPTSYLDMLSVSSRGAARELSTLVATGGAQFGQHAADLLGGEMIKYLTEMAGFLMDFRLLFGVIPGVTWQDPQHTYKMNQSEFWGNMVPLMPVSGFQIEYTNAYGWYWKQTMLGGGIALGVTKSGVEPGPMSVSLNVEATARPVVYWGHQNLDGVLAVADGPSVKGTRRGFGGKVQSGGMIKLGGSGVPGALDFENLSMELEVSRTGPDLPKDIENKNEISVTLSSIGLGYAWHDDEYLVSTPTIVYRPIPFEQVWSYVIEGFATGDDATPEERVAAVAERILHDTGPARQKFEQVKERLIEYGVDQEFKLDIACDGFATRLWQGAGNNERARLDNNERLALRRAQGVATALESRLGAPHVYSARSRGAAVPTPDLGGVTPERDNRADIDRWIADEIETQKQQFPGKPEDEIRREVEAIYGRTSNVQPVRRVEITVVWHGYDLGWDYGETPEPRDPNPQPQLPDGGGGAEGAGPEGSTSPDNGGAGGAPNR